MNSEPIESTNAESPASGSASIDEFSEDLSSPISPLTPEDEEILAYPPSNQQTLDCDWYRQLVDKKRLLTEAQTEDLPQSASTSNQPSTEGIFMMFFKC